MKEVFYRLPFIIFIFFSGNVFGQQNLVYESIENAKARKVDFQTMPSAFTQVSEDKEMLDRFESSEEVHFIHYENTEFASLNEALSITLPLKTGQIQLELLEVPASFYVYEVVTSDGQRLPANKDIKHYRGVVKEDPNSLVAISFLEDEVMGLVATDEGNFNLALDKKSGRHIFYNERNLKEKTDFQCGVQHDHGFQGYDPEVLSQTSKSVASSGDVCVQLYFETEFDVFQTRGSVASVESFVTAVFNQMATLYQNEDIGTSISEIFVWTATDPYTHNHPEDLLTQFQGHRTAFNGDLAQLLTFRGSSLAGWAAGFNGLCNTNVSERMSVSMFDNNYEVVPLYSGSVFLMAHEFGHLFGSRHTHACVWNGDNTAIDGCEATEGFCPLPGIPSEGGTIMSYCAFQSVGVNFNLGFGTQPGNVIRNSVANADCLCECVHSTISGPDFLCSSSSFTLQDPPSGSTVTWTAGPDSLFSQTSGTGTTANTGPLNTHYRGHGTITFHAETDCGTVDISKTVWVGLPSFWEYTVNGDPFILGSCHGVCPGFNEAEIEINGLIEAIPANVDWQLTPGGAVSWSWDQFTSRITFLVQPQTQFPFSFVGTATNPCGNADFTFCFISGPNCNLSSYAFSPNPADDKIVITNEITSEEGAENEVEILIINQSFVTVFSMKESGEKITVPTSHLPNGQYVLQISDKNGVYRKHLIIRH